MKSFPLSYTIQHHIEFINQLSLKVRKKIFAYLEQLVDCSILQNVIDVGVTADQQHLGNNFFENLFPNPGKIIALSDQDASWMEKQYKGIKFIFGDGRKMPFEDNTFDLVFSSAVIEHVGNFEQQCLFIQECYRVSRKHVFLTTPNRWYPIEFHTILPVIHWLPRNIHRSVLKFLGHNIFSQEQHLNLLSYADLKKFCQQLSINTYHINHVSLLGFPSNLLLYIKKSSNYIYIYSGVMAVIFVFITYLKYIYYVYY